MNDNTKNFYLMRIDLDSTSVGYICTAAVFMSFFWALASVVV